MSLVLIIEDNEKNLKLVRDVLQVKGYETLEAGTAEDGLKIARERMPDLVLMDIQLPGMSGIDALKALRADPATAGIPVVAITASVMQHDRQQIVGAGFDGFIEKPVNLKNLFDTVQQAIQKGQAMSAPPKILVVDDTPQNLKLLRDLLEVKGYAVATAASGEEALARLTVENPDLVLLDVMMPGMSGYDVCRKLREDPQWALLPVVLCTSLDPHQERVKGMEAGADDFLNKPVNQPELFARVKSLLRVKSLQDRVARQAEELRTWNAKLEERVREQVMQLERLSRLKRFVSPKIGDLILAGDVDDPLKTHRREITVVFTDLRGFTAFTESAEPEEVMGVLRDYHTALGSVVIAHDGTIEHFAGDGVMILFNDPVPVAEHELAAVRMALDMRVAVGQLALEWKKRGHDVGFGVGVANGYATMGAIGFEGRRDYGAIGPVCNLSYRLCSEAKPGQILVSQRVCGRIEQHVAMEPAGELALKGFHRSVQAFNVLGTRD